MSTTTLPRIFVESIKSRIGDNKDHGWGAADSLAIIEAISNQDAEEGIARLLSAGKAPTLFTLSEQALEFIKKVVNPSAFRQELEKAGRLNKPTKNSTVSAKLADLMEQY